MKIERARSAGFCFGVRRAIELAEQSLAKYGGAICSLGPLIHNQSVVERLVRQGVEVITDLSEAGGRPVLIRSHGATPAIFTRARREGIILLDATCPFVRRVQKRAAELTAAGFQVVVIGERDHPEVQGIIGWSGSSAKVVQSVAEVEELPTREKIGVLAQTTQNREVFTTLSQLIMPKGRLVRIYDTICKASIARQEEAAAIAGRNEAMVVVGGRNSANTCQLADICRRIVPTYHIEGAGELQATQLSGVTKVGVTAGASTPDWIIEEVVERMAMFDEDSEKAQGEEGMATNLEVTPAEETTVSGQVEESPETKENAEPGQAEMMEMNPASTPKQIQQGDVIDGTVVQVQEDEVLIDIGGKSEGVIPRQELDAKSQGTLKVGDQISVYVLRVDNDEGHLILSKKRADRAKSLEHLEQALDTKEELAGEVVKVVKGGLLVDVLGIRGFVPASLVERGYVGDLEKYIGQTLRLRVIEFDRNRGKVVLSQKAILQEEHLKAEKELWETIQPGEIRKGTVRHLTNFGAFVDLGGVDGLLHISELSWGRVKHPSEVVQEGDQIDVYVLAVDKDNKRISLSLKQAQPNPWDSVDERYHTGDLVTGKIVRLVSFGAFVELEPGVEGLVHISRLADHRVAKPEDVVSVGEEIKVKVLDVNKNDQRISLSIKDAKETTSKKQREEQPHNYSSSNTGNGVGVNLGDVFGDLFAHSEKNGK